MPFLLHGLALGSPATSIPRAHGEGPLFARSKSKKKTIEMWYARIAKTTRRNLYQIYVEFENRFVQNHVHV